MLTNDTIIFEPVNERNGYVGGSTEHGVLDLLVSSDPCEASPCELTADEAIRLANWLLEQAKLMHLRVQQPSDGEPDAQAVRKDQE